MNNEVIINNLLKMIEWRQNLKSFDDNKFIFNCDYLKYKQFKEDNITYKIINKNTIDIFVNDLILKTIVFKVNTISDILNFNDEKFICITNDIKLINKHLIKHKKSNFEFELKCELFDIQDFENDPSQSSYFNFIIKFDKDKYKSYKNDISLINIEDEFLIKYFNIKKDELICIIPLFNSLSFCPYIKLTN